MYQPSQYEGRQWGRAFAAPSMVEVVRVAPFAQAGAPCLGTGSLTLATGSLTLDCLLMISG